MKIGDKRGSHVGMVLSFVIFITFIFFLYVVFEPSLKPQNEKEIILDNLELNLLNYVKTDLTEVTISTSNHLQDQCVDFNAGEGSDFFIVRQRDGTLVNYIVVGNTVTFNWKDDNVGAIKIYGAENLTDLSLAGLNDLGCYGSIEADSTTFDMNIISNKYVSEPKILGALNKYNLSYDAFRTDDLKLKYDVDFEFIFIDAEGNEFATGRENYKTSTTDVYARNIPIIYFDGEANIQAGSLRLKVW